MSKIEDSIFIIPVNNFNFYGRFLLQLLSLGMFPSFDLLLSRLG